MPRGKNYVNNNKGMSLQASKKQSPNMEPCFYGAGCTRPDCIYRHDIAAKNGDNNPPQSAEPCMAFLSGQCSFSATGCRKRHPHNAAEIERLVAKYRKIPCRYGSSCKTQGCLYIHPGDNEQADVAPGQSSNSKAFPPLPSQPTSSSILSTPTAVPGSAWRPAPPSSSSLSAHPPKPPAAIVSPTAQSREHLNVNAKEFVPAFLQQS